ncbi:MAG: hypothetical protein AAF399_23000 [Bacteroidota bacterium]
MSETLELAREMAASDHDKAAIKYYERVLFFDKHKAYTGQIYTELADIYQRAGNTKAALSYLNSAFYLSETPESQLQIQFRQISLYLLAQDFLGANEELFDIDLDATMDSSYAEAKGFYLGITYFGLEQYDSAWKYFYAYTDGQTEATQELDKLFKRNARISKIAPRKAKLMSTFLPGLGQVYYGDLKNGLNSFLLTTGLVGLGIHLSSTISPLDAAFTVIPWFIRYYQGGIKRSGEIAQQKRQRKRAEVYQEILTVLSTTRAK